ncbi:MAG: TM0996/MTH895 family glutaredoxin-like protein [Spirochaetes bacterium]|nr:TM0996/MTH895 family glutaredoxin-like protein [Spirochaetota bacterium]
MKLEILGSGCAKCARLEELARQAASELGIEADIVKVKDIDQIMSYGVMITPALVVDGEVKVAGKVPSLDDIKKHLK